MKKRDDQETQKAFSPPQNPNKRPPNIKMKRSIARMYERDREALRRAKGEME